MSIKFIATVLALTLASSVSAFSQTLDWKAKAVRVSSNQYKIEISAYIPEGYHMYDFGPYGEFGPVPTSIVVEPGKGVSLSGGLVFPSSRKYDDAMYGMPVGVYEGKAVFVQQVKGRKGSSVSVRAKAMMCSGVSCIPPKETVISLILGK